MASKKHLPTLEQWYELPGDKWLEGEISNEILRDRIEPGLHLVKDQWIYLMSNGDPGLPLGQNAVFSEVSRLRRYGAAFRGSTFSVSSDLSGPKRILSTQPRGFFRLTDYHLSGVDVNLARRKHRRL